MQHTVEHLVNKIRNLGTFAAQNAEQKICAYKKCLELIELIYDDGDYGFACYHIGHINCLLAKLYIGLKDSEKARVYLEKGLYFSKAYDELPKLVKHSSLLLEGDIEDLSEVYNGALNRVAYEIAELDNELSKAANKSDYSDVLNRYTQYTE